MEWLDNECVHGVAVYLVISFVFVVVLHHTDLRSESGDTQRIGRFCKKAVLPGNAYFNQLLAC